MLRRPSARICQQWLICRCLCQQRASSLNQGRPAASLDALDAVLHIGVQLPQAIDDVVRRLPVAAPVGLQEGGDLSTHIQMFIMAAYCMNAAYCCSGDHPASAVSQHIDSER